MSRCRALTSEMIQPSEILYVWRLCYAAIRNDRSHERIRRYVESGIEDRNAIRNNTHATNVRNLCRIALVDCNTGTIGNFQIECGKWCPHIARDFVLFREDGKGIVSNLVRDVAICGNAVGADDNGVDQSLTHEAAGHVVGNHPYIDVVFP